MTRPRAPFIAPDNVVRQFSQAKAGQLVADGLKVFGGDRHGPNTKAYLWHVFSSDRFSSSFGQQALQLYRQQVSAEFIALSNDRKLAFFTASLPEWSSLTDFYVLPPSFAWTMAFTHQEGWLGPYFARRPDYAKLDAENRSTLQKRCEAEAARQQGLGMSLRRPCW